MHQIMVRQLVQDPFRVDLGEVVAQIGHQSDHFS